MKRLIYLIFSFLSIYALDLKAQTDTSKTKKDTLPPQIKLDTLIRIPNAKPVFQRDSLSLANKKKSAPLLKSGEATGSLMSTTTEDVGKTPVNIDISPSGAAIANIPISIPKGVNGFTPEISLTYNSQGGNGIAGYGWNIGGLSTISRIPATKFHNDRIGGINLDMSDFFALDGQRLLLKSGTYGYPGAEYQTENYSNLRIFSRGIAAVGTSAGPDSFEVWYPDGSKAFYGVTGSSKTAIEYGITYWESNLGARINYVYTSASNVLKLLQINYGTLGTGQGINVVSFSYQTAQRPEQAYLAGQNVFRDFILNKISISVSGTYLRHYNIETDAMNLIGYQRLDGLVETNGNETRSLGRIYFSYETSSDLTYSSTVSNLSISQIASNNSEAIFGDFTGTGSMGFVLQPTAKNKFWTFFDLEPGAPYTQFGYEVNTGSYKELFPIKWLNHDSKLLSGDGFAVVKDQQTSYKFDVLSRGTTAPVYFQYDRLWNNLPKGPSYYSEMTQQYHDGVRIEQHFLSGDFNGDGLTDIIAVGDASIVIIERAMWYFDPYDDRASYQYGEFNYGDGGSNVHLINLDRRITSNNIINLGALSQSYFAGDKLYAVDFNGDGKTDLFHVKNGAIYVYSLNNAGSLELLWQENDSRITTSNNEVVLLGDYNGDGKTDIMFSTSTAYQFALFMSNGKSFKKHTQMLPSPFAKGSSNTWYQNNQWNQTTSALMPIDINGDGKTDIAQVLSQTADDSSTGTITLRRAHNMGYTEAGGIIFNFDWQNVATRQTNLKRNPIPVVLALDKENPNLEVGFLSDNTLSLYRLGANMQVAKRLDRIWNKDETQDISYQPLMSGYYANSYNNDIPLYEANYGQTYPNVEFENVPSFAVVSKITKAYKNTNHLQQIFGYANAVTNTEGLGFLGFGKVIRSNWHVDANDENRMFNITLSDPALRGAPIKAFTTKYPYLNSSVTNMAAAPPNIVLSSPIVATQTTEASNSIILADGFEAIGNNGIYIAQITNPTAGVNDAATLSDYLTRTDYTYNTQLLPSKVFINSVTSVTSKDLLNGTNTLQLNEYDSYYNVTKTTTNLSGIGLKTEELTYDNNASGYYLGRPLSRKTTMSAAGDTHNTEEEYSYTGFLPTQIKKKGHGTPWITENLTYDAFGNVTQKSITTASGTRTTSATYDATGRFPTSQTDVEGLVTLTSYDPYYGVLEVETNPYGQETQYMHDGWWGRPFMTLDYMGNYSFTSFDPEANGYKIVKIDDEGREKTTYYNLLGQATHATEKTVTGSLVGTAIEYDVYGRAYRQSQPAAPGSYNQWNETEFDEYGRVKKTTSYTGKSVSYTYNGLITTVNDGTKSVTTTKNALGQTISVQDPGGTINYSYYAHGGLKTADYEGSTQSLEYDGWGRKTKLTDPSAGQYTYTYNGFGEIMQETTPKGVTNYTYNNATGKLSAKTLTGDETGIGYVYSYNNTTKLLTGLTFTNTDGNNATYSYTYDNDKRLSSTVEDNLHARFTKSYTYDGYNRIATETYQAKDKASNTTATRTVAYTYQNGELLQAVDQSTGKVLNKVNTLKSNGQLASELQGNSLKTTYNYDNFNLPQSTVTERIGTNPATLMNLGYSFDALRGNLNSRSNSALSWNESFYYDNQDRLTDFSDNNDDYSQTYDPRGRITYNSQLGNYGYSGVGYQQTELSNPIPTATTWYQDRTLQQLTFNAFKKPVNINEQGKEQIDFLYNAALQRSTMYYGSDDSDKVLRSMRRHYSEDGGMEITRNIVTGETSFVFYLSGDAYDAPAIFKEVHNTVGTTQNLYYLHRDHLGSIVLITDVDGNAVEKRQFDAWGNIVALTDGNGNPLTVFVITDRGYTGHEHLLNVGLINMNGRLYDPKLHRFLSPDNFVQDPYNTQNFNRYGYVMNNPLIASDPSGEFIHLIAGAIFGGFVNWMSNGFQFNSKGLGHFAVGALAGALGAGIGSGVSSALGGGSFGAGFWGTTAAKTVGSGFLSGAVVGASGGGAGGFVGGFGNGLVNGQGFGSSLLAGLKGGGMGALGGGIVGGVVGGIDAALDGRNFWTGSGESIDYITVGSTSNSNVRYQSTAEMRADYDLTIGRLDGMNIEQVEKELRTTISLSGAEDKLDVNGLIIRKRGLTGAYTGAKYSSSGKLLSTRIVVAPGVKGYNLITKNMIFKHEYLHVWHYNSFSQASASLYTERAASAYSHAYTKYYNIGFLKGLYVPAIGPYPKSFSWRLFNKIPLWL